MNRFQNLVLEISVVELIAEPPCHAKLLNDGVLLQLTKIDQIEVTSDE